MEHWQIDYGVCSPVGQPLLLAIRAKQCRLMSKTIILFECKI